MKTVVVYESCTGTPTSCRVHCRGCPQKGEVVVVPVSGATRRWSPGADMLIVAARRMCTG